MFRSPLVLSLISVVGLLVLLALPVFPQSDKVSLWISPAEPESGRTLLGERSAASRETPEPREKTGQREAQPSGRMTLTVPKLGIEDVPVPSGSTQEKLDRAGVMHLQGTGAPGGEGANTFITGHAVGYPQTRTPYIFYDLSEMKPGDRIVLESSGERYVYRVYDHMTVRPQDYWVTYPVEGRSVVSLQSCTPIPSFENRLVVRGELVS